MHQFYSTKAIARIAVLIFLFMLSSSCHQSVRQKSEKQPAKTPTSERSFSKGKVYNQVKCISNPEYSYALYLPHQAKAGQPLPVIFFFDAHARGWLPVKKYRQIADRLGYLLVASNDSQNGQSGNRRNAIIYAFMADVEQRFLIDTNRIYTAGFSGGARIAAGIGKYNKGIAGVIGCAAGNPSNFQKGRTNYPVADLVGNKDFNYVEILALESKMTSSHQTHQLIEFDGKHEWPPAKAMTRAFLFMETDAMRRKLCPVNHQLIDTLKMALEKERQQTNATRHPFARYKADKKLVAFLDGLAPVKTYLKEMEMLRKRPLYKKQKAAFENLLLREQKIQQQLATAMGKHDLAWWKNETSQLYKNSLSASTKEEQLMNRRLLNYLSLMSYLYTDANLKQGNPKGATKFLWIYQKVDPQNPEVYFLQAKQKAMLGASHKSIIARLKKSVDLGFDDVHRLNRLIERAGLPHSSTIKSIIDKTDKNRQKAQQF